MIIRYIVDSWNVSYLYLIILLHPQQHWQGGRSKGRLKIEKKNLRQVESAPKPYPLSVVFFVYMSWLRLVLRIREAHTIFPRDLLPFMQHAKHHKVLQAV